MNIGDIFELEPGVGWLNWSRGMEAGFCNLPRCDSARLIDDAFDNA